MRFNLDLFPTPFHLPQTVPVRGGTYLGQLDEQNVPHGIGFFIFDDTRNHLGVIYFGPFHKGQEHGKGFMYHPHDGSFSYETYCHGKRVESPEDSHAQLNDMLLKLMSTMCFFLYNSQDDLNIEKGTVEQVNSALVSARDKNDKLVQLLHSTPGVDITKIEAIMNPPHNRNTVRALTMDEILHEDDDSLLDGVMRDDGDMLDDTDDNDSTDDNESDEDYSDNDNDDEDYHLFGSSDDEDDE